MQFIIEITDTFGGEANYAWVKRAQFEAPANASDKQLIYRAKRALGACGRHKKENMGDTIRLNFVGACICAFIYPVEA